MEGVAGLDGGQDRPWRSNAYSLDRHTVGDTIEFRRLPHDPIRPATPQARPLSQSVRLVPAGMPLARCSLDRSNARHGRATRTRGRHAHTTQIVVHDAPYPYVALTNPTDSAPPTRPGSARACRSSSSARPDDPATTGSCGCPTPRPANASQSCAVTYGTWPASRSVPHARRP